MIRSLLKPSSLLKTIFVIAGLALFSQSHGESYPNRAITWYVPFAAGGGSDLMTRVVVQDLDKILGQSMVVDNRPGGATSIMASQLAKGSKDGYEVGSLDASTVTTLPVIRTKLPYDTEKSFSYVSGLAIFPWILVVNSSVPANNLEELIALAKQRPGELTYGSPSATGRARLGMERFQEAAGIELLHIPYNGDAPAVIDLVGGQIDMFLGNPAALKPYLDSGRLKGIAAARMNRLELLPDLPTFDEQGLKGFEAYSWQAAAVPSGTPQHIIEQLNEVLHTALTEGESVQKLTELGLQPFPTSPAEVEKLAREELAENRVWIEKLGWEIN